VARAALICFLARKKSVPDGMLDAGFSQDESKNTALQMQVRRRLSKLKDKETLPSSIDTTPSTLTPVSELLSGSSASAASTKASDKKVKLPAKRQHNLLSLPPNQQPRSQR